MRGSARRWKQQQQHSLVPTAKFFGTHHPTAVLSQSRQQPPESVPWTFPQPPPPPSTQDLHQHGLPLLVQVKKHAAEGRILLSGWKHEDGSVDIVTYQDVLAKARLVSKFLYQSQNNNNKNASSSSSIQEGQNNIHPNPEPPKLVAHLNVPGWDYVATQYGVWGAGYGSVPLALSQKVPELEHVLRDSDPHHIVVGGSCRLWRDHETSQHHTNTKHATHIPDNANELMQAADNLGMTDRIVRLSDVLHHDHYTRDAATSSGGDISPQDDYWLGANGMVDTLDEPALVLYTSGTTSLPKGTLITHRNIYHQVTDLVAAWEWQPDDVAVHVLPLHHVHGVVNLLSCDAFVGARLAFQPFDAESLWKQWATAADNRESESSTTTTTTEKASNITLSKPNVLMAVPTIYAKLLEAADHLPKETVTAAVNNTLQPMRLMVSGSAALPVSVLNRWKALTGHTLLERYGMTELGMALSNPYRQGSDAQQQRRPGYVGRPLPSVQVRLVNPDMEEVIDAPGISGELQVKGPTVFQRYLNRDNATKEAFTDDGYFRTGDIAQYDGGNVQSYRILGRASVDIIKTGGHKLSALEIERELLEHPDIAEVAVLGTPDDVWGERVAAICRMKPDRKDLTVEELRVFCTDRMSKEKIPSRLVIVSDIPKNAMGKINKKSLATLFES